MGGRTLRRLPAASLRLADEPAQRGAHDVLRRVRGAVGEVVEDLCPQLAYGGLLLFGCQLVPGCPDIVLGVEIVCRETKASEVRETAEEGDFANSLWSISTAAR